MSISGKNFMLFAAVAAVLCVIAAVQSVAVAVTIVNLCLVSAVMSLGLNIQWGYAGLPNLGVMGFAALGGLAVVLVSAPACRRQLPLADPGLLPPWPLSLSR